MWLKALKSSSLKRRLDLRFSSALTLRQAQGERMERSLTRPELVEGWVDKRTQSKEGRNKTLPSLL
jgi:hypothetical protein